MSMSESSPRQEATPESTDTSDKESLVCPTCSRDDFASRRGMLMHHAKTHGEKIRKTLNCEYCDNTFDVKPSHASDRCFCSRSCKETWESENLSGENSHEWQGGKIEMHCEVCESVFEVRKYRQDTAKYCSHECRVEATKQMTGSDRYNYNSVELECKWCNSTFKVPKSQADRRTFCSRDCYNSWLRNAREEHPAYKGGFEPFYGPNWTPQKRKALKRDQYRCQRCRKDERKIGRRPDVHHLKRIQWFKENYDEPLWYEKANDLENLVCLCRTCHGLWEGIPIRPDVRS